MEVGSSVDDAIINNCNGSIGSRSNKIDLPTDNFLDLALGLGLEAMTVFMVQ